MSETVTEYSAFCSNGLTVRWVSSLEEARAEARERDEKYPCLAPHGVVERKTTKKRMPDPLPTTPGSVVTIDGVMRVLMEDAGYEYGWHSVAATRFGVSQSEAARSKSVTVHFDAASIGGAS